MVLSARNVLNGTVAAVEMDGVMAEVVVELDGGERVTSTITRSSAERLDVVPGDDVSAVIKASDVLIDAE